MTTVIPLTASDLTFYRVSATDCDENPVPLGWDDCRLVLGRDEAENESLNLACDPNVMSVTCEPIPWGSVADDAILAASDYYNLDLRDALARLAIDCGIKANAAVYALRDAREALTVPS
jgi:hypothetical protein